MKDTLDAYQTHWHYDELEESLPKTPDSAYFFRAWDWHVQQSALAGTPGRVLDIACGNARDIIWLAHEVGKLGGSTRRSSNSWTRVKPPARPVSTSIWSALWQSLYRSGPARSNR